MIESVPITLTWTQITINMFERYTIHRSLLEGEKEVWTKIAEINNPLHVTYTDTLNDDQTFRYKVRIEAPEIVNLEPKIWNIKFSWMACDLPKGIYKMIPYFLVKQNNMPPQLIHNIGADVEKLGQEYLKIPFKRQGGNFIIT